MAGKIRVYRQRIRSVTTIKKSTRAMELVAASRIRKAQERSRAATPYARELTRAVSALATYSNVDHPITTERENPRRAAVLLISGDRGLAGAYSSNVIREAERLAEKLRNEGKEVLPYLCRGARRWPSTRSAVGRSRSSGPASPTTPGPRTPRTSARS